MRTVLFELGLVALIATGLGCGYLFLRQRNSLLGIEWLILGFSACNYFLYLAGVSDLAGQVALICDAFSRWIGIPIIALLGLMKATHKYEPPLPLEIALFVVGFLAAVQFMDAPTLATILPIFYLVMSVGWTLFLFYFARKLWQLDLRGHAMGIVIVAIGTEAIGILEGIVAIPGDETNLVFNFYFISHWGWAVAFAEIYLAYTAFMTRSAERATFAGAR